MILKKQIKSNIQSGGFESSGFSYLAPNLTKTLDICGDLNLDLNSIYLLKDYNSDVRGCINLIAQKTSINGLFLEKDGKRADREDFIKEYEFLENLFTDGTFEYWRKNFFANTFLSGENYLQPVLNGFNKVVKGLPLDSRAVSKVLEHGNLMSYKVNGIQDNVSLGNIIHSMYERSSKGDYYAIGVLHGVMYDILNDVQANKKTYAFYKNSGIPTAVFRLNKSIPEKQAKIFKEQLDRKLSGADNAYKSITNSGIEGVDTLHISNADMELISQRQMSTSKITSAFGVNEKLLGYNTNHGSYSEIKEIRKEFSEGVIRGHENYLQSVLNNFITTYQDFLQVSLKGFVIKCDSETFQDVQELRKGQRADVELGIISPAAVLRQRGEEVEDENVQGKIYIKKSLIAI